MHSTAPSCSADEHAKQEVEAAFAVYEPALQRLQPEEFDTENDPAGHA